VLLTVDGAHDGGDKALLINITLRRLQLLDAVRRRNARRRRAALARVVRRGTALLADTRRNTTTPGGSCAPA
jgi:hypothetical protein